MNQTPSRLEAKVHYAALLLSLLKASMWDAAEDLREWAAEWLQDDDDCGEETFDDEDTDAH